MAKKRKRTKKKKNPTTGTTIAIAIATSVVSGVVGFWVASIGCAQILRNALPPEPLS